MILADDSVKETNVKTDPNDGTVKKEKDKNQIEEIKKEEKQELNTSEKMKQSEFGYGSIPMGEKPQKLEVSEIPMDWKRQTISTISTTLMSFLPIALKYYNSTKDPNAPRISFDDVSDILIYKFPDLYVLIEKLTKGGKLENLITKGKILKIIFPLIPTIKALFKHKENVEKYNFDYMLLAHIVTYVVNTIIPMAMTNKSLNYAYHTFIKGTISNFTISALLRSRNPMCRELAKFFLEFTSMFHRAKTVINNGKAQMNGQPVQGFQKDQNYFQYNNPNGSQKTPTSPVANGENVPGKQIIDAVSAGLKIFTGGGDPYRNGGIYYNQPPTYDYYYGRDYYDPYRGYHNTNNKLWG